MFTNGGTVHSLPDAIGQVLENHIKRGQKELDLQFTKSQDPKVASLPGESGQAENKEVVFTSTKVVTDSLESPIAKISIANLGHAPACPDCGNIMMMAEGCLKCDLCGFSKCG